MLLILILVSLCVCGNMVVGTGNQGLSPPFTCTTTTTLCQPGDVRQNPLSPDSGSISQLSRPGKRGIRGPKGEKGDSCGCGDISGSNNLPRSTAGHKVSLKGEKGDKGDPGTPATTNNTELEEIKRRIVKLESEIQKYQNSPATASAASNVGDNSMGPFSQFPTRCSDLTNRNNLGRVVLYPLLSFHDITPYVVNCSDGGWITIQRRIDGSVNFYRAWRDYVAGFGNKDGEFWLGLENIHRLTSQRPYELYIDMKRKDNGASIHARYGVFFVDSEDSLFRLVVGDYSGNYADNMWYHNGLRFSTHDKDLDEHSSHCAQTNKGGWWYKACSYSNLNGKYGTNLHFGVHVSFVEMKIRPRCWQS